MERVLSAPFKCDAINSLSLEDALCSVLARDKSFEYCPKGAIICQDIGVASVIVHGYIDLPENDRCCYNRGIVGR